MIVLHDEEVDHVANDENLQFPRSIDPNHPPSAHHYCTYHGADDQIVVFPRVSN